jgi:glycosyltransferase involved in cell wall biosynthesis
MRILQILHDRERGGVQTLAREIESGLSPHSYEFVTDYLYSSSGLPLSSKLSCVLAMAGRIWRGDFDALIAYQSTASVLVGIAGWLAGCRWRIVHQTCTTAEMALPSRFLDRLAGTIGLYTVNIANSAATAAEFARYPAAYRRSMVLIEHGLDAPVPTHSREEARRHFNLPLSQPVVLNVGRLTAQKSQDLLIRVLACMPQAHLVIAGAGPADTALRMLAATLGVTDRLHMPGALPAGDIADLYLAADLFVFPSTWETFGIAAVEAAMVGLPMVVADLPVLREVLHVEGAAPVTFVAAHDVGGWISAVRAALEAPAPAVLATFARVMRRKYSRDRMIESYRTLLEARPGRSAAPAAAMQTAAKEARS